MTLTQVWGVLLIFTLCPLLGGLPLIRWIIYGLTGRQLQRLGTGNISVSAAFYHGGRVAGLLAVLSEAFKGIAAVLLARYFFPGDPTWEIVALIALVMGRYWIGKGAGTTNVVWGYVVHDWISAGLVLLIGGVSFTILRERQLGKLGVLVLLPLITMLRYPHDSGLIGATITLSVLMGWIYQKIPDDLDMSAGAARPESQKVFRFFRGDRSLLSLEQPLKPEKVGQKAAMLARLTRWGYPVPMGWALPPGDDPIPLIEALDPSPENPVVVRSSAIGEDSEEASAAGQYLSLLHITSRPALEQAILRCQASYNQTTAARYRSDRQLPEAGMAVLVQRQIEGVFSGVAFSRDPIARHGDAVVIEALPGPATRVVSGQVTPEQYRVWIREADLPAIAPESEDLSWVLPDSLKLDMTGTGDVPPWLIQQVAYLARHLEVRQHGMPQDIEWSYDGQTLWLLQARPITTLLPLWTRKIAAEVIPGFIHPLTWSINRPLTCGVWGDIFTLVLGRRARGLDFNRTATLHHAAAYFNATLLGQIFLRMGLPPESLEFLTRGAKFSKPPIATTLRNLPGLTRLLRAELRLDRDFRRDYRHHFAPGLAELAQTSVDSLPPDLLLERIDRILALLRRATYYSILAPLSAALRQAVFRVAQTDLDNSHTPEVAVLRALRTLAIEARSHFSTPDSDPEALFASLSVSAAGQEILQQFDRLLQDYGYLSEVGTDIAVPTWQENPQPVRSLFAQLIQNPLPPSEPPGRQPWMVQQAQQRLNLKGQVTSIYSQFLAHLRWSIVSLEQHWLKSGELSQAGDIFYLEIEEIRQWVRSPDPNLPAQLRQTIAQRQKQLVQDRQQTPPMLVYGNEPPRLQAVFTEEIAASQLQGIGASPGQVEGEILVLKTLDRVPAIDRSTILVVPYTDSGWAAILAQAGGLIAEVGGQLSHGAIIAREYGIPAVMNIHHATERFRNGQRVRLDGQTGQVEILS